MLVWEKRSFAVVNLDTKIQPYSNAKPPINSGG